MPLTRTTAADLNRERAERERLSALRRKERLKSHAIAGAILFAGAQFAYGILGFSGPNLLGMAIMAPFGAVLGLLATARAWGMAQCTLGGFTLVGLFFAALLAWGGGSSLAIPWIIVGAATSGGIPGCLVGFHVQNAT